MRVKDFYHDEIASMMSGHDAADESYEEAEYRAYHLAKDFLQFQKDFGVRDAMKLFERNLMQLQGK